MRTEAIIRLGDARVPTGPGTRERNDGAGQKPRSTNVTLDLATIMAASGFRVGEIGQRYWDERRQNLQRVVRAFSFLPSFAGCKRQAESPRKT